VVSLSEGTRGQSRTFVIADIPGLIPGASSGAGLGVQFLKHLERTRLLLHLITLTDEPGRSPLDDYHVIRNELATFDPELAKRPEIVAMTKADLPEVREAYAELKPAFEAIGVDLRLVSAVTHEAMTDLMNDLYERIKSDPPVEDATPNDVADASGD
jgi:GTP-binding protein